MTSMKSDFWKRAFEEAANREFADIPDGKDIEYAFSEKFERRMDALIRKQKSSYWKYVNTAGKRVAVACVLVMVLFTTACGHPAVREAVVDFVIEVYETFSRYTFEGSTTDEITVEYHLGMVPEGFEPVEELIDSVAVYYKYQNVNGDTIEFTQGITEGTTKDFDVEYTTSSELTVGEKSVTVFEQGTAKVAIWIKDGYVFDISCVGDIDWETIQRMIEGVKVENS